MSAADDIKNAAEKAAGKVKEGVGKLTDNERLEAEGQADQVKASAKQAGENVKDAAGKAGDSVRDAFDNTSPHTHRSGEARGGGALTSMGSDELCRQTLRLPLIARINQAITAIARRTSPTHRRNWSDCTSPPVIARITATTMTMIRRMFIGLSLLSGRERPTAVTPR
jgi:uncharacterized protein YjbJ (UPF0337 family)